MPQYLRWMELSPYRQHLRNCPETGRWEAADRVPDGLSGIRKWGRCPSSSKHLLRDPTREIRLARWCVRLPPPVLPPRVRERGGQNQHPPRERACRGPLALHQPYPNGVQRGFQKQNGGGLEGRHVTDGAGHEQVSPSASLRRFCHHWSASVADRISTPPGTVLAAARSPCTSHTQTGFSAGSRSRTVV